MSGFMPSNLVTRTQLIDRQDLSSTESLSKQVNCSHLSTEHTVGIRRLRRSQETLVKRLQQAEGVSGHNERGKKKKEQPQKKVI